MEKELKDFTEQELQEELNRRNAMKKHCPFCGETEEYCERTGGVYGQPCGRF